MVESNQLVEDDNNHGSGGSTRSLDEIPSANASKEAEVEQVMISLYKEIKWPMMPADQIEDDNKHGSEGSTSSIGEFARIFASTEIYHSSYCSHRAEMELMVRIYKETICPMIRADAAAQKLIVSSSEHWEEVVSFNDQAALIKHIKSQSNTTLNSFLNNLNIVIPHTNDPHDHTNLTSPHTITPSSDNVNNQGYVNVGVVFQSQSESPKRPASEHTISNSPKKPRDDQFPMSPPTNSVVTSRMTNTNPENLMEHSEDVSEDEEYLQYLNLSELDKWKMVSIAVGWISMISKVRKRRMTLRHDNTVILISASMT